MGATWGFLFCVLYVYRVIISVLAVAVVQRFTTLGDSFRYQHHTRSLGEAFANGSTSFTEFVGTVFNRAAIGNDVLINVYFMSVAFIGIIIFLASLPAFYRSFCYILMLSPSFTLWTSIASKEAIIVFFLGVFSALVSQIYFGEKKIRWYYAMSAIGVLFYKPHYLPAISVLSSCLVLCKYIRQPALLVIVGGMVSIFLLFLFRDYVDEKSFEVASHFLAADYDRSTRSEFFVEQYDVFSKAPFGMLISFWGPDVYEFFSGNILHAFSFVESAVIFCIMLYIVLRGIADRPLYCVVSLLFVLFWILFANYPFGVMNPGSAVRYRAGYYLLIVVSVALLSSRDGYVAWRKSSLLFRNV